MADSSEKAQLFEEPTADFVYLRMHGEDKKYKKGYTPKALKQIAKPKLAKEGKDVYVYFSTDEKKEYSPFDAMNLIALL